MLIEWKAQNILVEYEEAQRWMENRVLALQKKTANGCVWLLEHPPLYTMGSSGKQKDILPSASLPLFQTPRGGQLTYHGPGQRVVYVMLDLHHYTLDIRWYVATLEQWVIDVLARFGIVGERREGRIGIWVVKRGKEYKIAALGVRVQKWVTSHGLALNVHPDLKAYRNIVPCGLSEYGVTSLADLGLSVTLEEVDEALKTTFPFEKLEKKIP